MNYATSHALTGLRTLALGQLPPLSLYQNILKNLLPVNDRFLTELTAFRASWDPCEKILKRILFGIRVRKLKSTKCYVPGDTVWDILHKEEHLYPTCILP